MKRSPALATFISLLSFSSLAHAQVDLEIIDLPGISHPGGVGGIQGYSVGFTVCNSSNTIAAWQSSTNQHPTQSWGMFRISQGRIEKIGVSWIKHGNFAASTAGCGTCDTNINGARLGPGCRDTYDATYNEFQYGLGPRSDINAATGAFPYPPTIGYTQSGNAIYKRCQVADTDLAGQPAGTVFLIEGVLVHPQDAAAGHATNNASYRLINITPSSFAASVTGTTARNQPAIQAWRDHGLGINQPDTSVTLTPVDVPGDGRIWVGSKATNLGNGSWRYEYAIENLSSNRDVGAVTVPFAPAASATAFGFHDVSYHSGDIIDGANWPGQYDAASQGIHWSTVPFSQNPNANAIRYGTLYNFRFESTIPPATGSISLDLFRPGTPSTVAAAAIVPQPPLCSADFNGDNAVDFFDYLDFIAMFSNALPAADFNHDSVIDFFDYLDFVAVFSSGC